MGKTYVKIMLDKTRFKNKPTGIETGTIQKRLAPTTISIQDLANELRHGSTFKPAYLKGTKNIDWMSQQIFALDFDDGGTIDEAIDKCKKLNILPVFGYTSFSHIPYANERFRLVFCTPDEITDIDQRNKLQSALMTVFGETDQCTIDPTRLFYGGKSLFYENYYNRIDPNIIIDSYYKEEVISPTKAKTTNKPKTTVIKSNININHLSKIEAIRSLNVNAMRVLLYDGDLSLPNKEEYISSFYQVW